MVADEDVKTMYKQYKWTELRENERKKPVKARSYKPVVIDELIDKCEDETKEVIELE